MKNTIALKAFLALAFYIFFVVDPCPVLSSNLRLVPLNPEASSGENREYALLGEGLEGLGSLEVTLLYPPGSSGDVEVVFDDALQSDTSTAMANTNSPGSVRIGIIDATGFKNQSGELARISFNAQEDQLQPFRLKGSVRVTDLNGKSKNSQIDIEQPEMDIGEKGETDSGDLPDSGVNPSAIEMNDTMVKSDDYSQRQNSDDIEDSETGEEYKKSTTSNSNLLSGAKTTIPKNTLRPRYSKPHAKKKYSDRQHVPSSSRKKPSQDTPVNYEVTKVKEMDNEYIVTVDLPREKLNFVLFNGETIKVIQVNKKVHIQIRAEKECLLYLVTHEIIKIELGGKDIVSDIRPLNFANK